MIKSQFTVDAPLEAVWRYLLDLPKMAQCMPGAEVTEVIDERTVGGKIGLRVGPFTLAYRGRISLEEVDEAAHRVQARVEGGDLAGRGGASATFTSTVSGDATGKTLVVIETALGTSGVSGRFSRSAMLEGISQRMARRFAACVERQLRAGDPG